MTAPADTSTMSAECALAQKPEYEGMHDWCSRTQDIPLPHGSGLLLVPRCSCPHHGYNRAAS